MPKQLHLSERLLLKPHVALVHFVNSEQLRAIMADAGSLNINIEVEQPSDRFWQVHVTRSFEGEWPSIFRNLIGSQLHVREERTWTLESDDFVSGTMAMEVVGQPVTMHGKVEIAAHDFGSTVNLEAQTRASIAFIGGFVEDFAVRYLAEGIAHEIQEFNKFA